MAATTQVRLLVRTLAHPLLSLSRLRPRRTEACGPERLPFITCYILPPTSRLLVLLTGLLTGYYLRLSLGRSLVSFLSPPPLSSLLLGGRGKSPEGEEREEKERERERERERVRSRRFQDLRVHFFPEQRAGCGASPLRRDEGRLSWASKVWETQISVCLCRQVGPDHFSPSLSFLRRTSQCGSEHLWSSGYDVSLTR